MYILVYDRTKFTEDKLKSISESNNYLLYTKFDVLSINGKGFDVKVGDSNTYNIKGNDIFSFFVNNVNFKNYRTEDYDLSAILPGPGSDVEVLGELIGECAQYQTYKNQVENITFILF